MIINEINIVFSKQQYVYVLCKVYVFIYKIRQVRSASGRNYSPRDVSEPT